MTFPGSIPTLTDGPVVLRSHRPSDADRCVEQCVDPESVRWTTVPAPYALDDAHEFIGSRAKAWLDDTEWSFAVELEGRYAGSVSLRNEGPGRAEVAYGSHPDVRGTGAMERALRLLLGWGFEARALRTVIWWANQGNWASRKLAWRVGFSYDGCVRGGWTTAASSRTPGSAPCSPASRCGRGRTGRRRQRADTAVRRWIAALQPSSTIPKTASAAPTSAVDR